MAPNNVAEVGAFANPMRNHISEMIFSRLTRHPNTVDNNTWFDCHECWVCQRHNKLSVSVAMADKVLDPDFEQIIMLTAMMTKRS